MGRYAGKLTGLRLAKDENFRTAQESRRAEADARSADEYNYNKGRRGLLAEQDNLNLDYAKKRNAGLVQNQEWQTQDRDHQQKMLAQQEQDKKDDLQANLMNEGWNELVYKASSGQLTPEDTNKFNSTGNIKISEAVPKYDSDNKFAGVEITHPDGRKSIINPRMAAYAKNNYIKMKQSENAAKLENENRDLDRRVKESSIATNEAKARGLLADERGKMANEKLDLAKQRQEWEQSNKDPMLKEYNENSALLDAKELGFDTDSLLVDAKDKDGNAIKAYAPGADRIIGAVVSSVKSGADPRDAIKRAMSSYGIKSNYESLPNRIREVQKYRQDVSKGGKGLLWDSADVNKYESKIKQNPKEYQEAEQLHNTLLNAGASEEDITELSQYPDILGAVIAQAKLGNPISMLVSDARVAMKERRQNSNESNASSGLTSLAKY